MLKDKNGQPFFGPRGLLILLGIVALIGIRTFLGNQEIAAQRRAEAIPMASDPLCIKQVDDEAVAACRAHWATKGGCDPLGILPNGCTTAKAAEASPRSQ